MSKRSSPDQSTDTSIMHRVKMEQTLLGHMENFVEKGFIGSDDLNDPRGGLAYDPFEQPTVSFGIDYNHYFYEIFGAIEDPLTKMGPTEEPMPYIRRIRTKVCLHNATGTKRYDGIKPEVEDVQILELIDAFERYIDVIKFMTEAKVGLEKLMSGKVNDTLCGFRRFPQKKVKLQRSPAIVSHTGLSDAQVAFSNITGLE